MPEAFGEAEGHSRAQGTADGVVACHNAARGYFREMSYYFVTAKPETDPLLIAHSPYESVPVSQPHETACLVAALDTAAGAVSAAACIAHGGLVPALSESIRVRGLTVMGLKGAVETLAPHLAVAERLFQAVPTAHRRESFVLLLPARPGGSLGHAVAVTHEIPAGNILDPWPPGRGGQRRLTEEEFTRWQGAGGHALSVSLVG